MADAPDAFNRIAGFDTGFNIATTSQRDNDFDGVDTILNVPQDPEEATPYRESVTEDPPLPTVEYLPYQTAGDLLDYESHGFIPTDPAIIDPELVKIQAPKVMVSQPIYFPNGGNQPVLLTQGRVLIVGLILNVTTAASAADPFRLWNGRKGGGYPLFDIQATVVSSTGPLVLSFGACPIIADQGVVFDPGSTGQASGTLLIMRRNIENRPLQ
jgi:hypothetical protein